jgi:hypothetical protein
MTTMYSSTGYCATASFDGTQDSGVVVTACGAPCPGSPTSIDVLQGDRIVIVVSAAAATDFTDNDITHLAFQAGMFYAAN